MSYHDKKRKFAIVTVDFIYPLRALAPKQGGIWRSFNIDIEIRGRYGAAFKVSACIEGQDIIDRIRVNLQKNAQTPSSTTISDAPAPPGKLYLSAKSEPTTTTLEQQACNLKNDLE